MKEKSKIRENLLYFLATKGENKSEFYRKSNLSNGFIDKLGDNLNQKSEKKIAEAYPELNISWLLTGEGEMLKTGDNINIRQRDNNTNNIGNIHGIKDITALNDLKAKDDLIKHLQDEINYLRKQNETLMRMLEEK